MNVPWRKSDSSSIWWIMFSNISAVIRRNNICKKCLVSLTDRACRSVRLHCTLHDSPLSGWWVREIIYGLLRGFSLEGIRSSTQIEDIQLGMITFVKNKGKTNLWTDFLYVEYHSLNHSTVTVTGCLVIVQKKTDFVLHRCCRVGARLGFNLIRKKLDADWNNDNLILD